jgi:hypothetical protein
MLDFGGSSPVTQAVVESSKRFVTQKIDLLTKKLDFGQNFVKFVEFFSGATIVQYGGIAIWEMQNERNGRRRRRRRSEVVADASSSAAWG